MRSGEHQRFSAPTSESGDQTILAEHRSESIIGRRMAEGEGGDGVVLASRAAKLVVVGKGDRVAVDQEELLIPFEQRPNLAHGSAGAKDLRFEGEVKAGVGES